MRSDQAPPQIVGYRPLEMIGAGGFGEVYLYEQELPSRKVAVKVLSDVGLPEATRRQFVAEADAMAGLASHPHIATVFSTERAEDGRPCLIMQYYPGLNLSIRARREFFPVSDVLRVGVQIGSALETAHRSGVLHRDVKPHNILAERYGDSSTGQHENAILTDFGIAKIKGTDGVSGGVSVCWSAPEVLSSPAHGDERSDVYSLGATLWHLLVGRCPFADPGGGGDRAVITRRVLSEPPPRTGRRDVPESLERLLGQAMAKDPEARPRRALEMVRALCAVEQEVGLPMTPIAVTADMAGSATDDPEATRARSPRAAIGSFQPPAHERRSDWLASSADEVTGRRIALTEEPSAATVMRHSGTDVLGQQDGAGDAKVPTRSKPARTLMVTIGVVVALVVAGLAVALFGPRRGSRGAAAGSGPASVSSQSALGPGATAPGIPAVTGSRISAARVRFRWTYINAETGDVFRWHVVSGGSGPSGGVTSKPDLVLRAPKGTSVCVTVQVVRAHGGQASAPSSPACGS